MRYIQEVQDLNSLKTLVIQDLKDLGIKVPKLKKSKAKEDSADIGEQGVFGCHLNRLNCLLVDGCGLVPKFLINAVTLLERHINTEGLFRKSGSVARQKELRENIEQGADFGEANPLDVSSMIKQFFRELPDALLTSHLHDIFIKCYGLEVHSQRVVSVLVSCLILPWQHLCTLRYIMLFLGNVASHCENNKMDITNLAVCLAPNFIHCGHSNKQLDTMSCGESKRLEVERSIIELLIENAESIGMVSDSLYGRVQLLGSCFPVSEDELDRSVDALDETDAKCRKKKKRRSGSLQGLVKDLSSSFTSSFGKWRRDSKGHNASSMSDKSSMMSMVSDADASLMSADSDTLDGISLDAQSLMLSEFTPKLVRKRKASNEMVPFSATKKKAILQQMPQMSTLANTPFTPMHSRSRGIGRGHDFLDTPSIKFAPEGSSDMVFDATPGPTPRKNINKALSSPGSTTKVKLRHPSPKGKPGCFSPKTPKNKRRGVKVFLRRLSGGKDATQDPTQSAIKDPDGPGSSLVNNDISLPHRPISLCKKRSFFRRHRKTPSSPARLGGVRLSKQQSQGCSLNGEDNIVSARNQEHLNKLTSAMKLGSGNMNTESPNQPSRRVNHKRGFSAEGGIKRGKPNTVATGLPQDRYQPSPNRSRRSMDSSSLAGPPRHSSQRDIFHSPDSHGHVGVMDTSPISSIGGGSALVHEMSPVSLDDADRNDLTESELSYDESILSSDISHISLARKLSSASIVSSCLSEHDQAFIQDCSVLPGLSDTLADPFKKPHEISGTRKDTDVSDISEASCVSNESVITVVAKDDSRTDMSISADQSLNSSYNNSKNTDCHGHAAGNSETTSDTNSCSASTKSYDSGLGGESGSTCIESETCSTIQGDIIDNNVLKCATPPLREIQGTVEFNRNAVERSSQSNAKLTLSKEVTQRLSKLGGSDIFTAVPEQNNAPVTPGKVAASVSQFDNSHSELMDKHKSPLRFSNSVSRRRGVSPVRIPSIFAKADAEAERYDGMRIVRPPSPKPGAPISRGRPLLPISTSLVRSHVVEDARQKLSLCPSSQLDKIDDNTCSTKNKDHPITDNVNKPLAEPSTPRIKPLLLTQKLGSQLNKPRAMTGSDTTRRTRSPVKPVKRLQGSTRSPRSPVSPRSIVKSPKRLSSNGRASLSPIPGHVSNWEF